MPVRALAPDDSQNSQARVPRVENHFVPPNFKNMHFSVKVKFWELGTRHSQGLIKKTIIIIELKPLPKKIYKVTRKKFETLELEMTVYIKHSTLISVGR